MQRRRRGDGRGAARVATPHGRRTGRASRSPSASSGPVRRIALAGVLAATTVVVAPGASVEAASAVAGTVTNDHGEAADGVTVEVCTTTFLCTSTETDAAGAWSIDGLADGTYTIEFQGATGFDALGRHVDEYWDDQPDLASATTITLPGDAGTGYDAVLLRNPIMSGTVASDTGGPAEGIRVSACRETPSSTTCRSGTTAADGTYSIQLERYDYDYVEFQDMTGAHAREYWDGVATKGEGTPVLIADGSDATADAVLERLSSISGVVTDESGTPIEGIQVSAIGDEHQGTAYTRADGSYTVWVQEDTYRVAFFTWTHQYASEYWDDVDSYNDATPIAIPTRDDVVLGTTALVELASVSGTVTDESGTARSNVSVSLCATTCFGGSVVSDTTDGTGGYELAAPPGEYVMLFSGTSVGLGFEYYDDVDDPADATPITLAIGSPTVVDAELSSGGTISGRVTDLDGDPIVDLMVNTSPFFFDRTDVDGYYTIEVPAGAYTVEPRTSFTPYIGSDPIAVDVAVGEDVAGIDFVLAEWGSLTGTVTDPTGSPIEGVTVVVRSETSGTNTSAQTASDGSYETTRVVPGPDHTVEFVSSDYEGEFHENAADAASATLLTFANGEAKVVDAVLDSGGVIEGTVTDVGGSPLTNVSVRMCGPEGCRTMTTATDGTYRLGGLVAGEYTVRFTDPTGTFAEQYWDHQPTSSASDPVTVVWNVVSGGIDAVMAEAATVSGTVTSDGAPLEGIQVMACDSSESCYSSTGTDANGAYTLDGLLPDDYTVLFRDLTDQVYGSERWNGGATIPVTSGSTTTGIDIDLVVGGQITGFVTDASGAPIMNAYVEACSETTGACSWALSIGDGSYRIEGLAPADDWIVSFDTTWLSSAALRPVEWFCDAEDQTDALGVNVVSGQVTEHVDASMRLSADPDHDTCDADGDGVLDPVDNCPAVANPGQADADADGIGDVCDPTPNPEPDPAPDPEPDPAVVVSVDPARYLDNRPTGDTFDDANRGGGRTPAGGRVVVQVAGRGDIPAGATAAVMNLTAVNALGTGWATAHPCLPTAPPTSSVNFRSGGLEPNEIIVKLDPQGRICIDVFDADTFLLLDVVGYTLAGSAYTPVDPSRYADSRPRGDTFDDAHRRFGPLTPGTTIEIPIAGRGSVPATAAAVAMNLTATRGQDTGFATVHPCLPSVPNASSINYTAGVNRPNEIIAELSPAGTVCITIGDATVDLIVDVVGHLTATTTFTAIDPSRYADTRPQGDTVDDENQATGLVQPGTTYRVQIAGRGQVPDTATQAVVNLTVAGASATGYATVHPCLATPPTASSINYSAGTVRPNELVTQLDAGGGACITIGDAATHLIVDVTAHNG